MRQYLRSLAAFTVLVFAAPPQQPVPRIITARSLETGRWSLVLERIIQPAEGDSAELLDPTDLAITDDGFVAVSEPKPAHVKVFGPNGAFVRRVGREGSGPGEFRSGYIGMRGDTLVVQDPRQGRAVILNWRTGATIGGLLTARNYFYPVGIDASGRAVVRTIARGQDTTMVNQGFVRFPLNASRADTLWVTERRPRSEIKAWLVREGTLVRMGVPVPLQPVAVYAVDPAGTFVTGWSGEYVLRTTRNGRDTAMLFGRPYTPIPVRASEKAALAIAVFAVSLIPDRRPAFDAIHVDGAGRRWVRLATMDTSSVMFDVFGADGRWLDAVRVAAAGWPREAWKPVAFSKTHAAVVVEGDDDRPLIRIYRITRR